MAKINLVRDIAVFLAKDARRVDGWLKSNTTRAIRMHEKTIYDMPKHNLTVTIEDENPLQDYAQPIVKVEDKKTGKMESYKIENLFYDNKVARDPCPITGKTF